MAAIAVLINAWMPVAFLRAFFRALGPLPEGRSLPVHFALMYVVAPAMLAALGAVAGLLLFACRRSGRMGSVVFLALLAGCIVLMSSPRDTDPYFPLWFTLPTLGLVALPTVGRACR